MRWLRKNGVIMGCDVDGIEYNMTAVMQNEVLHRLYHKELKEGEDVRKNIREDSKRKVSPNYHGWSGVRVCNSDKSISS